MPRKNKPEPSFHVPSRGDGLLKKNAYGVLSYIKFAIWQYSIGYGWGPGRDGQTRSTGGRREMNGGRY